MREDPQEQGTEPVEQPASQEPTEPPAPEPHPRAFGTEAVEEGDYSGD
jgi:hypothetical protein